jgi:hypothetical protein
MTCIVPIGMQQFELGKELGPDWSYPTRAERALTLDR